MLFDQEDSLAGCFKKKKRAVLFLKAQVTGDSTASTHPTCKHAKPSCRAQAAQIAAKTSLLSHATAGQRLTELPWLQVCHDLLWREMKMEYHNGGGKQHFLQGRRNSWQLGLSPESRCCHENCWWKRWHSCSFCPALLRHPEGFHWKISKQLTQNMLARASWRRSYSTIRIHGALQSNISKSRFQSKLRQPKFRHEWGKTTKERKNRQASQQGTDLCKCSYVS